MSQPVGSGRGDVNHSPNERTGYLPMAMDELSSPVSAAGVSHVQTVQNAQLAAMAIYC